MFFNFIYIILLTITTISSTLLTIDNADAKPVLETTAFADEIIAFTEGVPSATGKNNNSPELVLGAPARYQPSLTLGCGGVLIVRFVDNALIDVEGDDLYIFEIGANIEATMVEISANATDWIAIGNVAGATAGLDIKQYVKPKQSFNYVRLTDLKQACNSKTPGADITAIAAIGSVNRYQFSSSVLFDFDKDNLKPQAKDILLKWLQTHFQNKVGRLQINGHTDQSGDEMYNLRLSKKRALSVANFLQQYVSKGLTLETYGLGESQPLLSNTNNTPDDAAAQNRRVEILYFAH
ncbi:MAG: OmpA family protein [Mariprofundales bacterium]